MTDTAHGIVPWRTITIGIHKTYDEYKAAFGEAGCRVNDHADNILKKASIAKEPHDVAFALVSVADLGFSEAVRYDRICERAKEMRLELCQHEDALAVRLAYTNQPMNDNVHLALEAANHHVYGSDIICILQMSSGLWLTTGSGWAGNKWLPMNRFVFRMSSEGIGS